jgi:hypothetical protein
MCISPCVSSCAAKPHKRLNTSLRTTYAKRYWRYTFRALQWRAPIASKLERATCRKQWRALIALDIRSAPWVRGRRRVPISLRTRGTPRVENNSVFQSIYIFKTICVVKPCFPMALHIWSVPESADRWAACARLMSLTHSVHSIQYSVFNIQYSYYA